jgi:acyl carrier protein
MTADEGAEVFDRILSEGTTSQIIVSPEPIEVRLSRNGGEASPQTDATAEPAGISPSGQTRPHLHTAYVAPRSDIERQIAGIWQELLGIAQVGVHDSFLELGGNSLVGTLVMSRLRRTFDVELPVRTLFEEPTVAALAEAVNGAASGQLDESTLARMAAEIKNLGDDEVREMLAREKHELERGPDA